MSAMALIFPSFTSSLNPNYLNREKSATRTLILRLPFPDGVVEIIYVHLAAPPSVSHCVLQHTYDLAKPDPLPEKLLRLGDMHTPYLSLTPTEEKFLLKYRVAPFVPYISPHVVL